jgi:hypothetical protein
MSMLAGLGPAWHRHQALVVLSGLSTRQSQTDRGHWPQMESNFLAGLTCLVLLEQF